MDTCVDRLPSEGTIPSLAQQTLDLTNTKTKSTRYKSKANPMRTNDYIFGILHHICFDDGGLLVHRYYVLPDRIPKEKNSMQKMWRHSLISLMFRTKKRICLKQNWGHPNEFLLARSENKTGRCSILVFWDSISDVVVQRW